MRLDHLLSKENRKHGEKPTLKTLSTPGQRRPVSLEGLALFGFEDAVSTFTKKMGV